MSHPTPGSPYRYAVADILTRHGDEIRQHMEARRPVYVLADLLGVDYRTASEAVRRLGWRWWRRKWLR